MAVRVTENIAAPIERVFELASDVDRAAERHSAIRSVERLDGGDAIGVGTRWRETRVMFGREATEEMEITDYRPPESFVVGAESHGCEYRSTFRFEPAGDGTRVELVMDAIPKTFVAKLLTPLGKMFEKKLAECLAEDLRDLKRGAEDGAAGHRAATEGA